MQIKGVLGYTGTPEYTVYFYTNTFIHANGPGACVVRSCMDISENQCFFSEGSFRLEFDMTVFANSLSVNFPGGKGVDCMAPRGPCLLFNDGI